MNKFKTFTKKFNNKYNWDNILKVYSDDTYNQFIQDLNKILLKTENSEGLLKSELETEIITENNISFSMNLLLNNNLSKKEIPINKDNINNSNHQTKTEYKSPFLPPFDSTLVLCDNFNNSHRLFLNKFPLVKNHIVVATKELIDQNTHLVQKDIESIVIMVKILKGLAFFNGGFNAGASQPHKHTQVIPTESIFNQQGIFSIIEDESGNGLQTLFDKDKSETITNQYEEFSYIPYQIKAFSFKHILIKFNSKLADCFESITFKNSEDFSQVIFDIYKNCLEYLEIDTEDGKLKVHYSFLMTNRWMLLVPRKTTEVKLDKGILNLNSMVYTMSILVKSKELKEEIINKGLLKIISLFGYDKDESY